MGLLTDSSLNKRNEFLHKWKVHYLKFSVLFYIAAIVWFGFLGNSNYNHATYLSENALSPGLVNSELQLNIIKYAQNLLEELEYQRELHPNEIPYAWIKLKMKKIGLEVYTQNFTLNYPFGGGRTFHGKNIYGILRSPRIASTEGIVFSTPYRPPNSVQIANTASIPILLAFAQFAKGRNYWSKDLIFLITDQEQLGIHAWLQAYHEGTDRTGTNTVLVTENLKGRAGSLQAAINIEFPDFDPEYVDLKIEGLNGQLPNLDMFNVVYHLAKKENLNCGYRQSLKKRTYHRQSSVKDNIINMVQMILAQANGVPTANHGHFLPYRIEALSLVGTPSKGSSYRSQQLGAHAILKTLEGVTRSLNNLLERLHQSFFFYILISNDRFVSIGDYIACVMIIPGVFLIKAFLLWVDLEKDKNEKRLSCNNSKKLPYIKIGFIVAMALFIGLLAQFSITSKTVNKFLSNLGFSTENGIFCVCLLISWIAFNLPFFFKLSLEENELLHIAALLFLSTTLIVIGLLNFALGFLIAVFIAPLVMMIDVHQGVIRTIFGIIYTFLLQPIIAGYIVCLILTLSEFPELKLSEVVFRAVKATIDAVTFAVIDSIIYGNWLFNSMTLAFLPNWILFWSIFMSKKSVSEIKSKTD